ncbi:outer membrane protein [Prochlorococcus marinus]|uniref:outer membrane protein n=1 Tax=Prochlorococcus marinus TaxID=1219 RepID=UPI0022B47CB3|nr:outer membrane beta-barrel protein [Prochlorococcus marinus]
MKMLFKLIKGAIVAGSLLFNSASEVLSEEVEFKIRKGDGYVEMIEVEDHGFYLTFSSGVLFPSEDTYVYQHSSGRRYKDDITSGFSGEMGIGYKYNDYLRSELSYQLDSIHINTENSATPLVSYASIHSLFINSSYFFGNIEFTKMTPYIGAGLGISLMDTNCACRGKEDLSSGLAYQFKGGISYPFNKKIETFGEVTYRNLEETVINGWTTQPIKRTIFSVGIRYKL